MSDQDSSAAASSSGAAAGAEAGDSGAGTALHYSLALFYLLIATFIIVVAWIIPNINMTASITFTLLGAVIFVCAIIEIVYTAELSASLCGKCPPPTAGGS
jgi:hypothetical protein